MNKWFIVLFILAQKYNAVGQVYSGVFPNEFGETGTAKYQYKTVDDEVIKQGTFAYEYKTSTYFEKITGQFKNGLRTGKWSYTIRFTDDRRNDGFYHTGDMAMSTGYNNGRPEGNWNFSRMSKKRSGFNSVAGWKWGKYEVIDEEKTTAFFVSGKLHGDFYSKCFLNEKETIKGQFKNGIAVGIWTFTDKGRIFIDDFSKVVAKESGYRYLNEKRVVPIEDICASFSHSFYHSDFNFRNIEGDLNRYYADNEFVSFGQFEYPIKEEIQYESSPEWEKFDSLWRLEPDISVYKIRDTLDAYNYWPVYDQLKVDSALIRSKQEGFLNFYDSAYQKFKTLLTESQYNSFFNHFWNRGKELRIMIRMETIFKKDVELNLISQYMFYKQNEEYKHKLRDKAVKEIEEEYSKKND